TLVLGEGELHVSSPDGAHVAVVSEHDVMLLDVASGVVTKVMSSPRPFLELDGSIGFGVRELPVPAQSTTAATTDLPRWYRWDGKRTNGPPSAAVSGDGRLVAQSAPVTTLSESMALFVSKLTETSVRNLDGTLRLQL